MDSRELGLVNSAFNSLLGTMSAQSTQQSTSGNSFNKIFDNKMQYADKKIGLAQKSSQYEKVNRDKMSATNYEQEKDRDAFVKSDMQKPKKPIAKAAKEKNEAITTNEKAIRTKDAKPTKETKAIESEDVTEVAGMVEEIKSVEDDDVIKELMMLLGNDQLTNQEKIDQMNQSLSSLTSEDLGSLKNLMGDLKEVLMSLNGSLKNFEETLSKISLEGTEVSNLLGAIQNISEEQLKPVEVEMKTKVLVETTENKTEELSIKESSLVDEVIPKEIALEDMLPKKQLEAVPKETKAEQLKSAAETTDKTQMLAEAATDSSANKQSSQQQSNTESNQSFAESMKFHSATVKTAAMKGAMTSNPFEEKIMQQIIKGTQISLNVGKDVSEMMIKLNPKDLGNVSLKISLKNDELIAEFSVENKTVKEVLESRLDDLKTALSDKGFTIQGLDVSVDQDENEQFRSYEEFVKQQKEKKQFDKSEESVEGVDMLQETSLINNTLETTSSEINTLA